MTSPIGCSDQCADQHIRDLLKSATLLTGLERFQFLGSTVQPLVEAALASSAVSGGETSTIGDAFASSLHALALAFAKEDDLTHAVASLEIATRFAVAPGVKSVVQASLKHLSLRLLIREGTQRCLASDRTPLEKFAVCDELVRGPLFQLESVIPRHSPPHIEACNTLAVAFLTLCKDLDNLGDREGATRCMFLAYELAREMNLVDEVRKLRQRFIHDMEAAKWRLVTHASTPVRAVAPASTPVRTDARASTPAPPVSWLRRWLRRVFSA